MYKLWRWVFPAIIFSLLISGCSFNDDRKTESNLVEQDPRVLLAYHQQDSTSLDLKYHLSQTLTYAGIPHRAFALSGEEGFSIPNSVKLLYITTDMVEHLSQQQVNQLIKFTAAGNTTVFLMPIYDERFGYLLCIKPDATYQVNSAVKGFYFKEDIFPHFSGHGYGQDSLSHYGFSKSQFQSIDRVIATAANDTTYPAIIEQNIGAGRIVYFNSLAMNKKEFRGLAFSAGLKALEGIPYRVANVSTIFLDDFPAPLYNKKLPPIKQEYNITHGEFVYEVWWPDMKQLADSFNIDYTAVLAFNYNAAVRPPFDFHEWEASVIHSGDAVFNGSIRIARDIRDSCHELGFHGYNHFSLWLEDWQNIGFMSSSLEAAKKRWIIDQLGPLPVTYVPPTNLIDSVGLSSLVQTMPQIKYMSSLYHGDIANGGGREFGQDPLAPSLFSYPRVTSGFTNSDQSVFLQQSMFIYTGIWTHFMHPDDVFQIEKSRENGFKSRNPKGLGWRSSEEYAYGLFDVFKKRLKETKLRYPVSRFLSVREAAPIVKRWLEQSSRYSLQENQLVVTTVNDQNKDEESNFWFMYVSRSNIDKVANALQKAGINYESSKIWSGRLLQFSVEADTFRIPRLKLPVDEQEQAIVQTMQGYRQYLNDLSQPVATEWEDLRFENALAVYAVDSSSIQVQNKVIKLAVEFESLDTAISVLEKRLLYNSNWLYLDIVQLLTYYGWNEQIERGYQFAERLWEHYRGEPAFIYVHMLTNRYGAQERSFIENWLKKELKFYPKDKKLLQRLIEFYNGDEFWPEKKKYIKQLIELKEKSDTLYAYALKKSIAYDSPQNTLSWLEKFPDKALQQLHSLSDDIAYMYANQQKYARAIMWAGKTDEISYKSRFYWLLQQERYYDFIEQGKALIEEEPSNAELQTYIGLQLLYANFREKGFRILYPMFKNKNEPGKIKELVHNEIGYMNYEQKQDFYRQFPAFFSNKQKEEVRYSYRMTEGIRQFVNGTYLFDNFGNQVSSVGLTTEWGNRRHQIYRLQTEKVSVNSGFEEKYRTVDLYGLKYRQEQNYGNQSKQFFWGGGIYFKESDIDFFLESGFGFAQNSSYTYAGLSYQPVFKNAALEQNIDRVQANLYREDRWLKNEFRTAFSLETKWFTDFNFSYSGSLRGYWNILLTNTPYGLSPLIEFSHSNALQSQINGFPYYAPDNLNILGGGINFNYQDLSYNPNIKVNLELMAKYDNRDRLFFASSIKFEKQIWRYWKFLLEGYFSTGKIYRYNSFDVSISYTLPKKF